MNHRWDFSTIADYLRKAPPYAIADSGNVLSYTTRAMHLTRGKLLQQNDWTDWQRSEYLQLDQYNAKGCLVHRFLCQRTMPFSTLFGHMQLKQLTVERRLDAYAMGPPA